MRVIIEGCDGTGKTTLANLLAKEYGLEVVHCTQHDPADPDFYYNALRKENTIWDRHVIGEMVYPYIFNRVPQTEAYDVRDIINRAKLNDVKIFVLTADEEVIKARLAARGDEHLNITNNIGMINSMFKIAAEWLNVPVIDTSKMTLQEIYDLLKEDKNA